jgi:hypothetical protein
MALVEPEPVDDNANRCPRPATRCPHCSSMLCNPICMMYKEQYHKYACNFKVHTWLSNLAGCELQVPERGQEWQAATRNVDERTAGGGRRLTSSSTGSGSTKTIWHCWHWRRSVGMTLRAPLRSEPTKYLKRCGVKLYGTCCSSRVARELWGYDKLYIAI